MVRYVGNSHAAYFLLRVSSRLLAVPRQDTNLRVRRAFFMRQGGVLNNGRRGKIR